MGRGGMATGVDHGARPARSSTGVSLWDGAGSLEQPGDLGVAVRDRELVRRAPFQQRMVGPDPVDVVDDVQQGGGSRPAGGLLAARSASCDAGTFVAQPGAPLGARRVAAGWTSGVGNNGAVWNPALTRALSSQLVAGSDTGTITYSVV